MLRWQPWQRRSNKRRRTKMEAMLVSRMPLIIQAVSIYLSTSCCIGGVCGGVKEPHTHAPVKVA